MIQIERTLKETLCSIEKQEHRINCVYTQLLTFKEVGWQFSLHVIVCTALCTTRNRICCSPFIDPVGLSDVKTGQQYNQKMFWGGFDYIFFGS